MDTATDLRRSALGLLVPIWIGHALVLAIVIVLSLRRAIVGRAPNFIPWLSLTAAKPTTAPA